MDYVICVKNDDYEASLELRKLYAKLLDGDAQKHGQVRVVDESGEDYLYPEACFISVDLPKDVEQAVSGVTASG